ncbi:hypothetical protein R0K17_29305, partial [Planococcus sp. SIMBA_143]
MKTVKMAINAMTIVNIVLNSYDVINPFEPGGACWISSVKGMAYAMSIEAGARRIQIHQFSSH